MSQDTGLHSRLAQVALIAVTLEAQSGCPAPMLIAQWAVESQWGAKPAGHANYFGIKKSTRHPLCCTVTTREVINGKSVIQNSEFADYASIEESCRDYAWLITQGGPYRAAWQKYQSDHNLQELIAAVARSYATDPKYMAMVTVIAGQANVAQAIAAARQNGAHGANA